MKLSWLTEPEPNALALGDENKTTTLAAGKTKKERTMKTTTRAIAFCAALIVLANSTIFAQDYEPKYIGVPD